MIPGCQPSASAQISSTLQKPQWMFHDEPLGGDVEEHEQAESGSDDSADPEDAYLEFHKTSGGGAGYLLDLPLTPILVSAG